MRLEKTTFNGGHIRKVKPRKGKSGHMSQSERRRASLARDASCGKAAAFEQ